MAKRVGIPTEAAERAVEAFRYSQYGRFAAIGRELGISKQAISGWRAIPAEWVRQLSDFTGIPAWRLRPDLYDAPPPPETTDATGR
jgi:hypothetical protein